MLVRHHLSLRVTACMDNYGTASIASTPRVLALKRCHLYKRLNPGFVAGLPRLWKQELSCQLQNSFRTALQKAAGKAKADVFPAHFAQLSGVDGTHYPLPSDGSSGRKRCHLRGRRVLGGRTNNLYRLL